MRLILIGLTFLMMLWLQNLHAWFSPDVGSQFGLIFGFLLLAGFLLGEVIVRFSVPRITGYLLAGLICGPFFLGFVDRAVVEHLSLVNRLALVLIAYTAGAELKWVNLRKRIRGIAILVFVKTLFVFLAVAGLLILFHKSFILFSGLEFEQIVAVAAVLGLIATAKSPATTVAVIVETRSRGPLTDTVLGATVLKDIVVLICFSLLMSFSLPHFSTDQTLSVTPVWLLLLEVLLSLVVGGVFGVMVILYLRYVGKQAVLLVLASAVVLVSLADFFHLDPLLVAVVIGFVVSNFSKQSRFFLGSLERAAGPVFVVFFCLAGAGLDVSVLLAQWPMVTIYIVLRTCTTWAGSWMGATLAKEHPAVRSYAWTGFLGQAGVSLGLASVVRDKFPGVGADVANLIIGTIVVNQIIGPIAFRWALIRSGEGTKQ